MITDYPKGFTTYFDVEFRQCHLPVTFSTGPFSPQTHWRQTSFFLRREYDLARGEVIRGIIKIEKDKICVRNLDIKIGFVVEVVFRVATDYRHVVVCLE